MSFILDFKQDSDGSKDSSIDSGRESRNYSKHRRESPTKFTGRQVNISANFVFTSWGRYYAAVEQSYYSTEPIWGLKNLTRKFRVFKGPLSTLLLKKLVRLIILLYFIQEFEMNEDFMTCPESLLAVTSPSQVYFMLYL